MTDTDLAWLARDNAIHTYTALAKAEPMAQVVRQDGYLLATCDTELAFCNFAADFQLHHPEHLERLIQSLAKRSANRFFRVFSIPGDEPSDLFDQLTSHGFTSDSELNQMVSNGARLDASCLEWQDVSESTERRKVAEFMVSQFFWRQNVRLRRQIVDATARSGLRLIRVVCDSTLVAAAMLVERPDSLGLYNLCVAPARRKRGLGSKLVKAIQREAAFRRVPLVLQCEAKLERWYAALGFANIGKIHVLSLGNQETFDIMKVRQEKIS